MKRIATKGFGSKELIVLETTGYKNADDGKAVWADEDGIVYDLSYARLAGQWAGTPVMSLEDGIEKGLYIPA